MNEFLLLIAISSILFYCDGINEKDKQRKSKKKKTNPIIKIGL